MRLAKKIALLLLVAFIAIQFIQPVRNKSGQVLPTDILRTVPVSPAVSALLKIGCYDCHSNNTNYPWFAMVQPIGWILNGHIQKGKAELNFSEFGSYTVRRQKSKLESIASQVNDNSMPLTSYTFIHKNAKLSTEDKALLIDWATQTNEAISTKR